MKKPPEPVLVQNAIANLRTAALRLIEAHTCHEMTNEHINEIKMATQIFDQAERLEKDLKG